MTAGSFDRSSFTTISGGRIGVENTKTWSGVDSFPRRQRIPKVTYETVREVIRKDGSRAFKKVRFRYPAIENGASKPTPKAYPSDNPYSCTRTYTRDVAANYDRRISSTPRAFLGTNKPTSSGLTNLMNANDQIKLVNKLLTKLKGSDFNMSVFLGESKQTLNMIADSAIRIAKAAYHVRRGDVSGAARSLLEGTSRAPLKARHTWNSRIKESSRFPNVRSDSRTAANNWLELQYGWLPLLSDAEAAAEQLAHHLALPMRQNYRAHVEKHRYDVKINSDGVANGIGVTASKTSMHHSNDRWLIARIQEADLPSAVQTLGLRDPELVAWELLPFSFVADWFIPIGDWMEARASANRLRGIFVTSDLIKVTCDSDHMIVGTQWLKPWPKGCFYDRASFTRSVSTTLKVPMPAIKPLSEVASWKRCANALALVSQAFTKREFDVPEVKKLFRTPNRMPESHWSF